MNREAVIYTQRVELVEGYQERRDCADQRIADFIDCCGFLPIPVPNKKELAESIIKKIQPAGIMLTGGNSLQRYGGNAPERDEMDAALLEIAIRNKIPLYGFCRGMQSILSYFGNELVNVDGHVAVQHYIELETERYKVNSYHNQACIELNKYGELVVLARTEDGVIEAVRHKTLPILGTMWHPEREYNYSLKDLERINKLFKKRERENESE